VIIAGAAFGVIVGRVLRALPPPEQSLAPEVEQWPARQLDAVLAPYEHVAA